jgi:hypothetical protein
MKINQTISAPSSNLFSKLSVAFSGLTLILIIILISYVPSTIKSNEGFPVIPKWLIVVTEISCLSGFTCSMVSLVRKERLKYLKLIGAVLNIFLFLFLFGTIAFALLMDLKRG